MADGWVNTVQNASRPLKRTVLMRPLKKITQRVEYLKF